MNTKRRDMLRRKLAFENLRTLGVTSVRTDRKRVPYTTAPPCRSVGVEFASGQYAMVCQAPRSFASGAPMALYFGNEPGEFPRAYGVWSLEEGLELAYELVAYGGDDGRSERS